jgi:hypothetical protein
MYSKIYSGFKLNLDAEKTKTKSMDVVAKWQSWMDSPSSIWPRNAELALEEAGGLDKAAKAATAGQGMRNERTSQ